MLKLLPTSSEALKMCEIYHRKPSTPWTKREVQAFSALKPIDLDELEMVVRYYKAHWPPRSNHNILRHDLSTFLRNYPSECDRARTWAARAKPRKPAYVEQVQHLGNGSSRIVEAKADVAEPEPISEAMARFLAQLQERRQARERLRL